VAADSKHQELEKLRAKVSELETRIAEEEFARDWQAVRHYPVYHATTGCLLGIFGAIASLLFNVIGSLMAGKNPLELIRVYLTFPLGEKALLLTDRAQNVYAVSDSVILAFGCCLYLLTGMVLGMPFYLALTRLTVGGTFFKRFLVASFLALVLWVVNFYGILMWLQPLMFGGYWIVDNRLLPWWVAAATHLVFGWTFIAVYPLGQFTPYKRPPARS
jgi:hypothetical protein